MRMLGAVLIAVLLPGCALKILPQHGKVEGYVWCGQRYMDLPLNEGIDGHFYPVDALYFSHPRSSTPPSVTPGGAWPFDQGPSDDGTCPAGSPYALAARGYPYVLVGAYMLQLEGPSDLDLLPVDYLEERVDLRSPEDVDGTRGFRAGTFIHTREDGVRELVIGFTGSNDARDWLRHNMVPWRGEQFRMAREYVARIHAMPEFAGMPLHAAGFSLGGGLAVHVAMHEDTRDLVDDAWALNRSPRDGIWITRESRRIAEGADVFAIANAGEFLGGFRGRRGFAQCRRFSAGYKLVDSSSLWGHGRYVLARQVMHHADRYLVATDQVREGASRPLQALPGHLDEQGQFTGTASEACTEGDRVHIADCRLAVAQGLPCPQRGQRR